jgi:hypothetical protein
MEQVQEKLRSLGMTIENGIDTITDRLPALPMIPREKGNER